MTMESQNDPPAPVRPRGPDRRRRPTPWISRYWLTGRRRGPRRASDPQATYVDRYTTREWLLVGAILLACALDLVLTLDFIGRGGEEWNPVMAHALEHGDTVFVLSKMGITCAGLLLLLMRVRFRGVRRALQVVFGLYLALMLWHGAVRVMLPEPPVVLPMPAPGTRFSAPLVVKPADPAPGAPDADGVGASAPAAPGAESPDAGGSRLR